MEHFISLLFLARDVAHREHLRTRSYAAHMALNDFYHEIIEQADGITEAYQGSYQLLKDLEIIGSKNVDSIEDFLKKQVTWIDENRYKVCGKDDTPIQNLIDGIMETYFTVLYKLRFLK
jgi:hypothetical protein